MARIADQRHGLAHAHLARQGITPLPKANGATWWAIPTGRPGHSPRGDHAWAHHAPGCQFWVPAPMRVSAHRGAIDGGADSPLHPLLQHHPAVWGIFTRRAVGTHQKPSHRSPRSTDDTASPTGCRDGSTALHGISQPSASCKRCRRATTPGMEGGNRALPRSRTDHGRGTHHLSAARLARWIHHGAGVIPLAWVAGGGGRQGPPAEAQARSLSATRSPARWPRRCRFGVEGQHAGGGGAGLKGRAPGRCRIEERPLAGPGAIRRASQRPLSSGSAPGAWGLALPQRADPIEQAAECAISTSGGRP